MARPGGRPESRKLDPDVTDVPVERLEVRPWNSTSEERLAANLAAGKPAAPPTQVHVYASTSLGRLVWRFRQSSTLDALIATLIKHRIDVWGVPQDPMVWRAEGT